MWHANPVIVIFFPCWRKRATVYCLISVITFCDILNWKHFRTGTLLPSGSRKAGSTISAAQSQPATLPQPDGPSPAAGPGLEGKGQLGWGAPTSPAVLPHLRGWTIPHTHRAPSSSQLFETPPHQQNTSVANATMEERVRMVGNVADIGEDKRVPLLWLNPS